MIVYKKEEKATMLPFKDKVNVSGVCVVFFLWFCAI